MDGKWVENEQEVMITQRSPPVGKLGNKRRSEPSHLPNIRTEKAPYVFGTQKNACLMRAEQSTNSAARRQLRQPQKKRQKKLQQNAEGWKNADSHRINYVPNWDKGSVAVKISQYSASVDTKRLLSSGDIVYDIPNLGWSFFLPARVTSDTPHTPLLLVNLFS